MPVVAEERNDAGDLAPVHDRKGELGVEPGAQRRSGLGRIAICGDVFDGCCAAGRPHSTHQPGPAGKGQVPTGGLEGRGVPGRAGPAELQAQHVGIAVHRPKLADRPAQRLADALQNLRGRLGPGCGVGQGSGDRKLDIPEALRHASLADVADERHERHPGAGARRRRYRDLDRKLVAIPVQPGQLDGLAHQPAFAGFDEPRQPSLVGIPIATRNDRADQGPTDGFVVGPAEDLFRFAVPAGDQAILVGGDHRAWRGVDDDLQPLLGLLEFRHDPQLDLGVPAGRGIETNGAHEERGAGQHHQAMPDVPESVVPGLHEHEDHGLDADEHQAGDHACLDPALGAARAPVSGGDKRDHEKGGGLKQGVVVGEATPDDQRRHQQGQRRRQGDGNDTDAQRQANGPDQRPTRLGKRTRPVQQDPGEEHRCADVGGMEEEAGRLVRRERQRERKDAREGQHVLEPQHAEHDARERQGERPAMAADDHVGRREKQDDGERHHHGAVQHRHIPGQGQGGIGKERAQHGNQHQDGGGQQRQQSAGADAFQASDGTAGCDRQDVRDGHSRNIGRAP